MGSVLLPVEEHDLQTLTLLQAHRTLIVRKLKGLESIIDFTCVHEHMGDKGTSGVILLQGRDDRSACP